VVARERDGYSGRVVELFAGVGGFRLGLEPTWRVIWANQWEPGTRRQHAYECYVHRFGADHAVCQDIAEVVPEIPDHDLLVGGFPCQDYSVARTLNQAAGLEGRKGVLWWQIHRVLERNGPPLVLLENVDRLLKSPAGQRGRDFAVMLACFARLGYVVEWRVVNAADYGFPQRRRRVFIVAHRVPGGVPDWDGPERWVLRDGTLATALPVDEPPAMFPAFAEFPVGDDPVQASDRFGVGARVTPFRGSGVMWKGHVWTADALPAWEGPREVLADVVLPEGDVDGGFFILPEQVRAWEYLKNAKREQRVHRATGTPYWYAEGGIAFPDPLDRPSRTILTGEGGTGPSRFKHVIRTESGRLRRLTPVELERLNGFPDDWTNVRMSDGRWMSDARRAFLMGNALVVGIVERIGQSLAALNLAGTTPAVLAAS
jgi:DNA (cytosine-5)-methyltransferase 1